MPLPQLLLSSDAKPRLKWTPELHLIFIRAVDHLGGAEKATPKSLLKAMGIQGLTLYHLKSHLQKYRSGRSQRLRSNDRNKLQGNQRRNTDKICIEAPKIANGNPPAVKASLAQKKLREQIEVQKHLQLRIEAQGKYIQTILKKAHATLSNYISCSIEVENAFDHLAELASLFDSSTCPSSSLSTLMENDRSILKHEQDNLVVGHHHSRESSLTSLDHGEVNCVEMSVSEDRDHHGEKVGGLRNIDLNSVLDSGSSAIDLNFNGVEILTDDETFGGEE